MVEKSVIDRVIRRGSAAWERGGRERWRGHVGFDSSWGKEEAAAAAAEEGGAEEGGSDRISWSILTLLISCSKPQLVHLGWALGKLLVLVFFFFNLNLCVRSLDLSDLKHAGLCALRQLKAYSLTLRTFITIMGTSSHLRQHKSDRHLGMRYKTFNIWYIYILILAESYYCWKVLYYLWWSWFHHVLCFLFIFCIVMETFMVFPADILKFGPISFLSQWCYLLVKHSTWTPCIEVKWVKLVVRIRIEVVAVAD